MTIHIKRLSSIHLECWVEIPFEVVAECKVIDAGDQFLVDEIYTKPKYRRKGYAKAIIEKLKTIKPVQPAGIVGTVEAVGFWDSLGMKDALGDERTDYTKTVEQLLLENCNYDFKIVD